MTNLRSGMSAPETGVYEVEHGPHRLVHQVTIVAGDILPKCRKCGTAVKFTLIKVVDQTAWAKNAFTYPLVPYDSEQPDEDQRRPNLRVIA